jgi:hypothetical protein
LQEQYDFSDKLLKTKSYQTLEKLFCYGTALCALGTLCYGLYSYGFYNGDVKEVINIVLALGLSPIIAPIYDKIRYYMPPITPSLKGYACEEILGVFYFFERRGKTLAISYFSANVIARYFLFPSAAAEEANFYSSNSTETYGKSYTSICGENVVEWDKHTVFAFSITDADPSKALDWTKEYPEYRIFVAMDLNNVAIKNFCDNAHKNNIDTSKLSLINIDDIKYFKEYHNDPIWKEGWLTLKTPLYILKNNKDVKLVVSIDDTPVVPEEQLFSRGRKFLKEHGMFLVKCYYNRDHYEDEPGDGGIPPETVMVLMSSNVDLDLLRAAIKPCYASCGYRRGLPTISIEMN